MNAGQTISPDERSAWQLVRGIAGMPDPLDDVGALRSRALARAILALEARVGGLFIDGETFTDRLKRSTWLNERLAALGKAAGPLVIDRGLAPFSTWTPVGATAAPGEPELRRTLSDDQKCPECTYPGSEHEHDGPPPGVEERDWCGYVRAKVPLPTSYDPTNDIARVSRQLKEEFRIREADNALLAEVAGAAPVGAETGSLIAGPLAAPPAGTKWCPDCEHLVTPTEEGCCGYCCGAEDEGSQGVDDKRSARESTRGGASGMTSPESTGADAKASADAGLSESAEAAPRSNVGPVAPSEPAVETLKPCPFCGSSVAVVTGDKTITGQVAVTCSVNKGGCGGSSGYYRPAGKSVAAWNRRAEPAVEGVAVGGETEALLDVIERSLLRAFDAGRESPTLPGWEGVDTLAETTLAALRSAPAPQDAEALNKAQARLLEMEAEVERLRRELATSDAIDRTQRRLLSEAQAQIRELEANPFLNGLTEPASAVSKLAQDIRAALTSTPQPTKCEECHRPARYCGETHTYTPPKEVKEPRECLK